MKLCINCRHHTVGKCDMVCGLTKRVSPVDGSDIFTSCSTERAWNVKGGCGHDGANFEAQPVTEAA